MSESTDEAWGLVEMDLPPRVDGDLAWVDWLGRRREYHGPLVGLGYAIPRPHRTGAPASGIRRAVFDLAFGYLSGFPLRDVLAFSVRSLLPSAIKAAEVRPALDDGEQ